MKLKQEYATETFISKAGYYCIKQGDGVGGEDVVVVLSPHQVEVIAKDMQDSLAECKNVWHNEEGFQ